MGGAAGGAGGGGAGLGGRGAVLPGVANVIPDNFSFMSRTEDGRPAISSAAVSEALPALGLASSSGVPERELCRSLSEEWRAPGGLIVGGGRKEARFVGIALLAPVSVGAAAAATGAVLMVAATAGGGIKEARLAVTGAGGSTTAGAGVAAGVAAGFISSGISHCVAPVVTFI